MSSIDYRNRKGLLALANAPIDGHSVLDWRPFTLSNTLGKIINDHNAECIDSYKKIGWIQEDIKAWAEIIEVSTKKDISKLNQLEISDLDNINILLLDLDAADVLEKQFSNLSFCLIRQARKIFLTQVTNMPNAISFVDRFRPSPVIPSNPEILLSEESLRLYLKRFSDVGRVALSIATYTPQEIRLPGRGIEGESDQIYYTTQRKYKVQIPKMIDQIRAQALSEDWSQDIIEKVTISCANQEFALARIDAIVGESKYGLGYTVVLDAIKEPTYIEFGDLSSSPEFYEVDLLKLQLSDPQSELAEEQHNAFTDLGFRGNDSVVIHYDQPEVWNSLNSLGDAIQVTKFTEYLPRMS